MHSFRRKISTACQIPLSQWLILAKSWFILLYVRLRMDLTPFASWKHWLVNAPGNMYKPLNDDDRNRIIAHRRMINLASRYHIISANCLPKSITLKWLLGKHNINCEIVLGLKLDNRELHGHAWLQRNDVVLNDNDDVALRYPVRQELGQKPIET